MSNKSLWSIKGVTKRDLVRVRRNSPWCFWNIAGKPEESTVAQRKNDDYTRAHLDYNPLFSKSSNIYAIGSCFARNIEEHLHSRSVRVLSREITLPENIYATQARPNAVLNQYSTASMFDLLDKQNEVLQPILATDEFYAIPSASSMKLLDRETVDLVSRALQKSFDSIQNSDCVILTLGQNECWYDNELDVHWNAMPPASLLEKFTNRFEVKCSNYVNNNENLEGILSHLLSLNPSMKIILTVSPVPLHVTFSGDDALLSNEYNKSVLRVIAEEASRLNKNVFYFPSYEMCRHTIPANAYVEDHAHIRTPMVAEVVDVFFRTYMES